MIKNVSSTTATSHSSDTKFKTKEKDNSKRTCLGALKHFYMLFPQALTVNWPATPKSANFACPSVLRRMFPAFISLCIFLIKCKYSSPLRVDFRIVAISSSVSCKKMQNHF